jgi:hypothetical protein
MDSHAAKVDGVNGSTLYLRPGATGQVFLKALPEIGDRFDVALKLVVVVKNSDGYPIEVNPVTEGEAVVTELRLGSHPRYILAR